MTNDLNKIERQCRALMTYHGVGRVPFRFSKSYRSIAHVRVLRWANGTTIVSELAFSRRWALVLPDHDLHEVMIHEIAHVLNPNENHGWKFQQSVRLMGGISTKRCYLPSVNLDGTPRQGYTGPKSISR